MKSNRPAEQAWSRLASLAAHAGAEPAEVPFGFAGRVVAAWKADRRETTLAAFEWLTIRGLAVALVILVGSAAFGYDAVAGMFEGENSLAGGWLDILSFPL